ncbi:hypothetical protein NBRC116494_23730 [Aurantivibrio plasticivorans]
MATFTLCYSGTDCFLDQALVFREPREMYSYNPYSGYVPSKIHKLISDKNPGEHLSVTMNGCGGPYGTNRDLLPIRAWTIESEPETGDSWAECRRAPAFINDSVTGASLEYITVAGLAEMLGVTFHMVEVGNLNKLLDEEWLPQNTDNFTRANLAYPQTDNGMWNNNDSSTAGHFCLRWSEEDNIKIELFLQNFDRVVLLGHSRGGVSCIIAANYLSEWFPSLEIKICALDPVPGTGDWWPALTHLPGAKSLEYVGIYAIDETSSGFNGVVPRVKSSTEDEVIIWDPLSPKTDLIPSDVWNIKNYELLYTRGRHATVPGSRSAQGNGESDPIDNNVGSSGNLTDAYVISKLNEWGVALSKPDKDDVALWIGMMNSYSAHFASMRDSNYGPKKILGKMNGWWYYNARGISSTDGRTPSAWMYMEAFIELATGDEAAIIDTERGLIDMGVRNRYYAKYGGTGKVHPWVYLADACKP